MTDFGIFSKKKSEIVNRFITNLYIIKILGRFSK